jgi:uncharacterized MAPEG superfamily protein
VGDPDLTPADRGGREAGGRPRGLVVFPLESLAPAARRKRRGSPRLREWWIVFAALALAAAVIGVALLVR